MVKAGAGLRTKVKAPELDTEPLALDFIAGLASAVQRTACREPLRHDARALWIWDAAAGTTTRRCQACGEQAPCRPHQPRLHARNHEAVPTGAASSIPKENQ